jgi:hypothetical protein
MQCLEER